MQGCSLGKTENVAVKFRNTSHSEKYVLKDTHATRKTDAVARTTVYVSKSNLIDK